MQGVAKDKIKEIMSPCRGRANSVSLMALLILAVIVIYFYAQRPFGYTISGTRDEAKRVGKMSNLSYLIAAGLVYYSLKLKFLKYTVVWFDDGSILRKDHVFDNMLIAIFKIVLVVLAIFVMSVVSSLLLLYLTIQGLKRNFV